jgi:hypothetical protein
MPSPVRAAQSNQSEGRSDTKGGQQLVHPAPHRGDLASSSFIYESCPFGWAGIEPFRFSPRITRERRVKPPSPDLIGGGGH